MTSIADDSIVKPPVRVEDIEGQNWNDGLTLAFHILLPLAIAGIIWGRKVIISRLLLQLDRSCVSVFCPSLSKREKLIRWVMIHLPYLEGGLGAIWRDGSQLCTLINTIVPGACPNPHRHWRKPPTHGQALAYKYLGVTPIFSEKDLKQRNFSAPIEKKLLEYITTLEEAIAKISHGDELTFTNHYIARGMGLVTGEQHRKTIIYIYPNCKNEDLENLLINIRGPYKSYGASTLHYHDLVKLKPKIKVNANEDIPKPENKSFLKTLSSDFSSLLTIKNPIFPLNDIDIKIDIEKDRAKILFIPKHSGVYEVCLTTAGEHIGGSPYSINIEKNRSGINDAICQSGSKVAIVRKQILDKIKKVSPVEAMQYTPYKEFIENNESLKKLEENYSKPILNDIFNKSNDQHRSVIKQLQPTNKENNNLKVIEQNKTEYDLSIVVERVSMLKKENRKFKVIENNTSDHITEVDKASATTEGNSKNEINENNKSDTDITKSVDRVSIMQRNEENNNEIILNSLNQSEQSNSRINNNLLQYTDNRKSRETANEITKLNNNRSEEKCFKHYNPDLLVGHTNGSAKVNAPPVLNDMGKDVNLNMTNKIVSNISDRNVKETLSHKTKLRKCRSAFDEPPSDKIINRNLPNLVTECSCDISNSDDSLDLRLSFMRRKEFWDKMSSSSLSLNSSSLSLNDISETASHKRIMRLNKLSKSKLKNQHSLQDTRMFRSLDFIEQRRRSIKNDIPLIRDKYASVDELNFPSVKERRRRFLKERGSQLDADIETITLTNISGIPLIPSNNIEESVKIELEKPTRKFFGSIHDKIKLFDKNVTHTERRFKPPMMKLNTCVIERKVPKIKKIPENGTIKTKIKERFEKAQSFFKELENASRKSIVDKENDMKQMNISRRHSLGNNDVKLKRSEKGGSLRVLNVSEKFNISNLYKDIVGDKSNSNIFKGAPNKKAVVRTLTVFSPEVNNNNEIKNDELSWNLFEKNNHLKRRKSVHDIFTY